MGFWRIYTVKPDGAGMRFYMTLTQNKVHIADGPPFTRALCGARVLLRLGGKTDLEDKVPRGRMCARCRKIAKWPERAVEE